MVCHLADELRKDNRDLEELTPPLLVLASTSKEDFWTKDMSSYTFQVVGGVHSFLAILKINEDSHKKITTRKCAIYGTGLSCNAILRLGAQHLSPKLPQLLAVGSCLFILVKGWKMMANRHRKNHVTTPRSIGTGRANV